LGAFYNDKYVNDVVNIGGNVEVPIVDLAKIIINVTCSSSKLIHMPALEEGDMTRRLPDTSKMQELLKREVTPFETGLRLVIQHGQFISLID
jgi:UDP-glucose 4-epimerase